MAGWFAALKTTAAKGATKAAAARNFIRPKGKGGGGAASPQDPDKVKVEAKRIKTTPSILKVNSLTFRKIGDSNTFIKFIGSAGSELNKVKIPDKRGLLSRMNLAGSGNSAMNMLLASVADPKGIAETAGMGLGVGAVIGIPGILGLRQLFKKKPNIKPNIKPDKIKGPKIKNTIKKPKINRINAKNNIVKTNRIKKPNLNLNKGGGILKRIKNIKGVSKSNVILNTVFAGFEFADRKSSGQTNTQAVIGTGSSLAGGIAGAAIGQALIPIPVVGALIGGGIGSWISTKLADKATGADKVGAEETEEKKNEIDGQEDLNKITEQVRIKSQKLNGIVDKFDGHVMALASLMDRRPETKDKMIYTEEGSIERATVNVNNTNNINTKLKVDQSMITSISNDDSEDTIFITQESLPMNPGQGGGMIPIPVGGGGGGLAVATQSESELVNSVWSNILLTKLASK